jgi:YVTN family beta-propeller protein
MHDAAAHHALPDAIGDGARESAVLGMRDELGELCEPLCLGRLGVDCAQLGPEEARAGELAGPLVAAMQLQRLVGDDGGERIGVVELPVVDEAIVARRALEIGAEEDLRDILRELQFDDLAGVDVAAPLDALDEALGLRGRQRPVAASMSMDGNWLYVTNNVSSSLSVIDLGTSSVNQIVQLPSRPEGVEVGADGRVLINMVGSGVVNGVPQGTLAIFDRNQQQSQQLIPVDVPALPTTPAPLPPTVLTRPITTFAGKLIRTPDGQFIVGVITPTDASTYLFVYEVASGVILRNRTVAGQSSVLSMSPDGSRFMAGLTMFDTATLGIVGQYNNANAPFTFNAAFNIRQNIGGSAFTSAGSTLYSAFNVAAFASPAPRRTILDRTHTRPNPSARRSFPGW